MTESLSGTSGPGPGAPVEHYYKFTISTYCHKSVQLNVARRKLHNQLIKPALKCSTIWSGRETISWIFHLEEKMSVL